jgi:aspartyl/asparaginyl beta-hydroxylase (cupin superfamily)
MQGTLNTIFWITGIAAWTLVAIKFVKKAVRRVMRSRRVREWRNSEAILPYAMLVQYRYKGLLAAGVGRALGAKIAPEIVEAHRAITLEGMTRFRDALKELDSLPTVQKGKAAMAISSVFELATKPPNTITSAYTHPLQYPPYFIPGVPARTFYQPDEFEWAKPLEDAFPIIRDELMNVLNENGQGFKAYMSEYQTRVSGWNTFNFFFYGGKNEENCARCPRTTAILESLPRFERDHIMFSALNPHARISPHTGPMNGIIRAHLGMVVPQGAYIRVGRDERTWQEGKLLVFDDSFEHEVWNHSDFVRIVLFINFWHPCFAPEEIPVLERFRQAYELAPLSRVHERNQAEKRAHDLATAVVPA